MTSVKTNIYLGKIVTSVIIMKPLYGKPYSALQETKCALNKLCTFP